MIYWMNLLRLRFWVFILLGPLVASIAAGLIFPWLFYPVMIIVAILAVWHFLHVQMACHSCGRILAVTRLEGSVKVCGECGHPTDN